MTSAARESLWVRLREAALVAGEPPAPEDLPPWFVRVMLGVAGWLAAAFLLGFVGAAFAFVFDNALLSMVIGASLCAAAAFLFISGARADLASQFAFAVSLAGQGLMVAGLAEAFGTETKAAWAIAVQQSILFVAIRNFAHRTWAAASAGVALVFALGRLGVVAYAPVLLAAGFALVWLREFERAKEGERVRAAGYGLAVSLVLSVVLQDWHDKADLARHAWASAFAAGAVLVCATVLLLQREGIALGSPRGRFALAGAAVLALVSLKAPGLAPATLVLVTGYANGNRLLAGLGVLALIGYLSYYYYSLQATLLEKSALLAAAGVTLLLARLALRRWWPAHA